MREPSDSAALAGEILDGLGVRWALIGPREWDVLDRWEQARRSR